MDVGSIDPDHRGHLIRDPWDSHAGLSCRFTATVNLAGPAKAAEETATEIEDEHNLSSR
jgi:hypothetical protein